MKIECIPNSAEKYMMIKIGKMQLKDSFGFLSSSLDTLSSYLKSSKGLEVFKCTWEAVEEHYGDKWSWFTEKRVYPYDYMDYFEKFKEIRLPSRECFYSSLNDESISIEDYERGNKVLYELKMKDLGEYTLTIWKLM